LALPTAGLPIDWPHAQQIFQLTRERTVQGQTTREVSYGITSLTTRDAPAQTLLTLVRSHWGIENRLHWVRDMTFGEDACRVRSGAAPQFLAAMRNTLISLLHKTGFKNKAAAVRQMAAKPQQALALIRPPGEN